MPVKTETGRRLKLIKFVVSALIVLLCLFLLQKLLSPKYATEITEGSMVAEYYNEVMDHDLLFIGDCEVYASFSPKLLWEEYGINSYIRGSAQQLIWQSYYLLEDSLRYETPDAVVFNVLSMQYNVPQREEYNRMTLDGMKWSMSKVRAIQASMTDKEQFLDYVFPLLRYHSRWSDLNSEDIEYLFKDTQVSHNGYYMEVAARPAVNVPEGRILADYSFGENAYAYLDKIRDLCSEKGIQLILVKAPSLYPYWYEEWEQQMEDYARENGLLYINFLEHVDEIGLDYNLDTYDAGLHLNLTGAEKLTEFFGQILREETDLADRRGDEALEAIWQEKALLYEQDAQAQYQALAAAG